MTKFKCGCVILIISKNQSLGAAYAVESTTQQADADNWKSAGPERITVMADEQIVETVYGKYSKYEIVKKSSLLGSPKFYIRKNGKPHRGPFSSLKAAVETAQKEG